MTTATTSDTGLYHLYGIVAATATLPEEIPEEQQAGRPESAPDAPAVGTPRLLPYGSVAALVGGPLAAPPQTTRAALLDHAALLNRVAPVTAVLPARFGMVLSGVDDAVAMLAAHEEEFRTALDTLQGRVQYTVKAQHIREAVLQEIIEGQPEVARLREQLAGADEPGYYEQIRLGELVAQALAATCEADAVLLWDTLTAHAFAAIPRAVTSSEAPFGGAFLVDSGRRAAFENAAEQLAAQWQGRARVRLLGPLAPYDFVTSSPDPSATRNG